MVKDSLLRRANVKQKKIIIESGFIFFKEIVDLFLVLRPSPKISR